MPRNADIMFFPVQGWRWFEAIFAIDNMWYILVIKLIIIIYVMKFVINLAHAVSQMNFEFFNLEKKLCIYSKQQSLDIFLFMNLIKIYLFYEFNKIGLWWLNRGPPSDNWPSFGSNYETCESLQLDWSASCHVFNPQKFIGYCAVSNRSVRLIVMATFLYRKLLKK